MTFRVLIPLTALLFVACGPADEDEDGFTVDDDCDDTNADINPGATDLPRDGVDSDCDGEDPPHEFEGDWNLVSVTMDAGDGDNLAEATVSGSMTIEEDLSVVIDIDATQGEESLSFDITGDATADGVEGDFDMDLSVAIDTGGDTLSATGDWACTTAAATIDCTGSVVLEQGSIAVVASFDQ